MMKILSEDDLQRFRGKIPETTTATDGDDDEEGSACGKCVCSICLIDFGKEYQSFMLICLVGGYTG